ncbi:MAG: DUF5126 domain-containing protein [Prevotellaceae bacterium]|jgi:hypothetical protein|nr:DUF5126 domain-containing protein [Prevotellaceae bacterium]
MLWNVADNINVWDYTSWHEPVEQVPDDYFSRNLPFVKYVQFMTAAGGNEQRDLFKEPLNRTASDDYDFASLIRACRNVLRLGLILHLKLGNVPLKYSTNETGAKLSFRTLKKDTITNEYVEAGMDYAISKEIEYYNRGHAADTFQYFCVQVRDRWGHWSPPKDTACFPWFEAELPKNIFNEVALCNRRR